MTIIQRGRICWCFLLYKHFYSFFHFIITVLMLIPYSLICRQYYTQRSGKFADHNPLMYLIPLYPKECNFSTECCNSWFLIHWCSPSGDLTRWWHQILIILSPPVLFYIFQQSICSNWVTNTVAYSCIKHREHFPMQ